MVADIINYDYLSEKNIMSKVKALYHIVFCTKRREMTISESSQEDLYRFIWSVIKENNCKLLRIGGIENHVHILLELNQAVALSHLMREIKSKSSGWMIKDSRFPDFAGWAKEYFASTISPNQMDQVINYIKNQKEHHGSRPIETELCDMYRYANLEYTEKDMM